VKQSAARKYNFIFYFQYLASFEKYKINIVRMVLLAIECLV